MAKFNSSILISEVKTLNSGLSSLEIAVTLKKVDKILKQLWSDNLPAANKEFIKEGGDDSPLQILGMKVSKYNKPTRYEFSNYVKKAEIELKALKECEIATKVAVALENEFDPKSDSRFKVG